MKRNMRAVFMTVATAAMMAGASTASADGAVMIKTGSVALWDDGQFLDGQTREFDQNSSRTFAIALEKRKARGIGLGIEYINYRHGYVPANVTEGQAKTQTIMFRVQKYFGAEGVVHPYVGFGFGPGHTSVSGGADLDPEVNLMMQANVGVEFRVEGFSFLIEAKGLYSNTDGPSGNEYDPSATGFFGGIAFLF